MFKVFFHFVLLAGMVGPLAERVSAADGATVDFEFIDAGAASGIGPYLMAEGFGGGVAASDFDDDGDVDLFVPTAAGMANQLYENLGGGVFVDIAATVGLASLRPSRAALWLDYDGDHLLDLIVAGDCVSAAAPCDELSAIRLYRQVRRARFAEVTRSAGFIRRPFPAPGEQRAGLCAGDINNDGYIDLMTGLWGGGARLFMNRGDGTFADVSVRSGIGGIAEDPWQPVMHDFDGDGFLDIFAAVDFAPNHLWLNQGTTKFRDVAVSAGVHRAWNDMGVALGDYDNDGDFDIYVTEFTELDRHNVLFQNESTRGRLRFKEVGEAVGVGDTGFGWGVTFLDANNDGWIDLAATNGWFNGTGFDDSSKLFLSNGQTPVTMTDVSDEVGFDDQDWGSSLIALDYDRDGDLDLAQTCNVGGPLRLWQNTLVESGSHNNFLVIQPRMGSSNHRAIGAVVRVRAGDLQMTRLISAGSSHMGQEPAEAFFGLADSAVAEQVSVDWPGGGRTVLRNVRGNRVLVVSPTTATHLRRN